MEIVHFVAAHVVAPSCYEEGCCQNNKLIQRFDVFMSWESLLEASARCDEQASVSRRWSRRRDGDDVERRAARAELMVDWGELCSAKLGGRIVGHWQGGDEAVAHRSQASTRVVGPHPSRRSQSRAINPDLIG